MGLDTQNSKPNARKSESIFNLPVYYDNPIALINLLIDMFNLACVLF